MKFVEFPKMARFSREVIITEKIDGTNASVIINPVALSDNVIAVKDGFSMRVGSRTRWIKPGDDNMGFAKWCLENSDDLFTLGEGRHFGEWWGSGIQRNYGLPKGEKRFSLFNVSRWDGELRPKCCHVVPTLWKGIINTEAVDNIMEDLKINGSYAFKGFMKPEGIVLFHVAGNVGFKKTLDKDEIPKSLQ